MFSRPLSLSLSLSLRTDRSSSAERLSYVPYCPSALPSPCAAAPAYGKPPIDILIEIGGGLIEDGSASIEQVNNLCLDKREAKRGRAKALIKN